MTTTTTDTHWTDEVLAERLAVVREALLDFLRERTRLELFKHKVRWRLSRQHIWPGPPEVREATLAEAVEGDFGVEAFRKHIAKHQQVISKAIERYNHAVRRHLEDRRGVPGAVAHVPPLSIMAHYGARSAHVRTR